VWQSWQPLAIDTRSPRSAEISPAALADESVKAVTTRVSGAASRIFSSGKAAFDGFVTLLIARSSKQPEVIGIDVSQLLEMGLCA
jgi:hypothetical protein